VKQGPRIKVRISGTRKGRVPQWMIEEGNKGWVRGWYKQRRMYGSLSGNLKVLEGKPSKITRGTTKRKEKKPIGICRRRRG